LQSALARKQPDPVSEEVVSQIVAMGFDPDTVRAALSYFNADINQVVSELVQRAGIIPSEWYSSITAVDQQPSVGSTPSPPTTSSSDSGLTLVFSVW